MNKTSTIVTGIAFAALFMVGGILFLPTQTIEITASAEDSFVIDEPMERVRKILVRTNSVKTIVAMANAELTDQEWLNLEFDNEGSLLDREWKLAGEGRLNVRSQDSYLGDQDLVLEQKIKVQPQRLESANQLIDPAESIREYRSALVLTPGEDGKASFETSLNITIRTEVTWLTRSTVEAKIRKAPAAALKEMEQAIRKITANHADKILILPKK